MMIFMVSWGTVLCAQEADKPLKYNVSVEALTFPVFAVDARGNPVYDIKKDEIVFSINGKPMEFQLITFGPETPGEEEAKEEEVKEEKAPLYKPANRVIFLILDSMFNTRTGFKRSKAFLRQTITVSYPGETFVVLENEPRGGLRHVAGPDTDQAKLLAAVDQLKWYPEKYRKFLFIKPKYKLDPLFKRDYYDVSHGPEISARYKWTGHDSIYMNKVTRQMETAKKNIYGSMFRQKIKRFGESLSQFRYVLQTTNYPKIVFLISEGVAEETIFKRKKSNLKGMSQEEISKKYYFFYLRRVIQAINSSGTVLYTISPKSGSFSKDNAPGDLSLDEMSLEYLADKSGGKYFKGADVKKVAREIKQTTAAYYEVVFTRRGEMPGRQAIDITCKREGVTLFTPRYNERAKPYHRMEPVQKKVFAHNLILGGNWSRMVGKVRKVTYENLPARPGVKSIAVMIPEKMKKQKADIFLLTIDPKTKETRIQLKSKVLGEREVLSITAQKDKEYYFAIIDPMTTYCIYSNKDINGEG
jgi:hypothetical protein